MALRATPKAAFDWKRVKINCQVSKLSSYEGPVKEHFLEYSATCDSFLVFFMRIIGKTLFIKLIYINDKSKSTYQYCLWKKENFMASLFQIYSWVIMSYRHGWITGYGAHIFCSVNIQYDVPNMISPNSIEFAWEWQ